MQEKQQRNFGAAVCKIKSPVKMDSNTNFFSISICVNEQSMLNQLKRSRKWGNGKRNDGNRNIARERRLRFAGHWYRSQQEISSLLFWRSRHGRRGIGRLVKTYIDQLEKDTGVERDNLPEPMQNRDIWKKLVNEIWIRPNWWW